ncbi:hypothetical protein HK101_008372 [Irineochytrium annulatum]|nr:hypothetical protein HK101_008372 [Irineochytrium annulatum]
MSSLTTILSCCFRKSADAKDIVHGAPTSAGMTQAPAPMFMTATSNPSAASYELFSKGICPFTQTVRLTFRAKGLNDFVFTKWGPENPEPDWTAAVNSAKTVPILRLPDGTFLTDSADMIEHIERTFPQPSIYAAKDAAMWAAFARNELKEPFMKVMQSPNPAIQAEMRPKLQAALEKLEEQLKWRRGFLLSQTPSVADILLAPFLHRLPLITYFRDVDYLAKFPHLRAYVAHIDSSDWAKDILYPLPMLRGVLINMLPKQKAMSLGRLQHEAVRRHFKALSAAFNALCDAQGAKPVIDAEARDVQSFLHKLLLTIETHAGFEEEIIYPFFDAIKPGATQRAHGEHAVDGPLYKKFERDVDAEISTFIADPTARPAFAFAGIVRMVDEMGASMDAHMDGEEKELFPITNGMDDAHHVEMARKVFQYSAKPQPTILPFVLEVLTAQERMQYMHNVTVALKEVDRDEWERCKWYAKRGMPAEEWEDLVTRLPALNAS